MTTTQITIIILGILAIFISAYFYSKKDLKKPN